METSERRKQSGVVEEEDEEDKEWLDVVNDDDEFKYSAPRSRCHDEDDPLLHRSTSVLTFKSEAREEVLVQRRSEEKERKPELLEVTGGHLESDKSPEPGESYLEAAVREYAEELYSAEPADAPIEEEDLEYVDNVLKESDDNRELMQIYETVLGYQDFDNCDVEVFDTCEDEVQECYFVDLDKLLQRVKENPEEYTHATRKAIKEYCGQPEQTEETYSPAITVRGR